MTQSEGFFEHKRKWSTIKDDLLANNLRPYFTKILATGRPIIYIDGFAGKGKFDDGTLGSPLLAMKTFLESVKNSRRWYGQTVKFYFIEKSKGLYPGLCDSIQRFYQIYPDFTQYAHTYPIEGNYLDKIKVCTERATDSNIFLYLDPYGIKDYNFHIISEIEKKHCYSFEILCNFNAFGFFREACNVLKVNIKNKDYLAFKFKQDKLTNICEFTVMEDKLHYISGLNRIFGSDDWQKIIKSYQNNEIDGVEAEKRIADGVALNLRSYFKYVLDMPIRVKSGNVPKYRMIHASNSVDGCYLMAWNINKRKDDLIYSIQKQESDSLFGDRFSLDEKGDLVDKDKVKFLLQDAIAYVHQEKRYKEFLAEFFTKYGIPCPLGDINKIMEELEKKGKVVVRREPSTTSTGRIKRFWSETKENKIFIRSKS